MVNGTDAIFVERDGVISMSDIKFRTDAHLRQVISRIVTGIGRRIDETSPMVDARLPDGSRVNAVIPPLAVDGPSLTIRKFMKSGLTASELIDRRSITPQAVSFLQACVQGKLNILVSGGTGTGKTTFLNMLQAMNTGHDGSLTTLHANAPREATSRLETMVMFAGFELPARAVREQMAAAIDIIIQLERLRDGRRMVTSVTEVIGLEGDQISLDEIFTFEPGSGPGKETLRATGVRPRKLDKMAKYSIQVDQSIFDPGAGIGRR